MVRLAQFATQLFVLSTDYTLPRERHLFIAAASDALDYVPSMHWLTVADVWNAFDAMLSCMCRATVLSLRRRHVDCGAQIPLPWFASLQSLVDRGRVINKRILYHKPLLRDKLYKLLTLLQQGVTENLWGHDGSVKGQEAIQDIMQGIGLDGLGDAHMIMDADEQEQRPTDIPVSFNASH